MSDRTTHAWTREGNEIVRYDRAGKWYVEGNGYRTALTLAQVVELATEPGAFVYLNRPGGKAFDAKVRKARA